MNNSIIFKDINGSDMNKDLILEKMRDYKSKGNRKIEEKVIKEQLKSGFIRFVNAESGEWCDADIADVKELVELLKNKTENKQIKNKTNIENDCLIAKGGEECGNWRGNINVDYNNLVNNLGLKWDEITWVRDSENDYRNYSILVKDEKTEWTIYDWDTDNHKNKWFISGEGSEKQLNNILKKIENGKLFKHPKQPYLVSNQKKEKKQKDLKQKEEKIVIELYDEIEEECDEIKPKKKQVEKKTIEFEDLNIGELNIDEYEIED